MGYYINQIENSYYKQYKYQYLDRIETTIDIRENYWDFSTQLFLINNCVIPPGSIVGTLELPYQQVKDIGFFYAANQERAKTASHNPESCHIYDSRFNVDISANEFFKQEINNTKINCSIKLEIDPQQIKVAGSSLKQEDVDTLIAETAEQKWDFSMYYTNTHLIEENEMVSNTNGYKLETGHECSSIVSLVDVGCNSYKDNDSSINELTTISSNAPFQIISAKVKFYYWLEDEAESKTFETNLILDRRIDYFQTICFNQRTTYDFVNNKVTLNSGGILGFYIPKYSHGYYDLELSMNQNNCITKYIIRNPFVFLNNINTPHITSSKIRIDSLEGFERIKWNG